MQSGFSMRPYLPLALIGGVIAIFLTGRVMSVSFLIGFIGVFGIAARNGIILVSHYRHLRAEGRPRDEVILEGSKDRLAPVLMTAAAARSACCHSWSAISRARSWSGRWRM
jgi:Cu/Ag efflux pump CusA